MNAKRLQSALREANNRRVEEARVLQDEYKKVDDLFRKIQKEAEGLGKAKTREDRLLIVDEVVEGLESLIPPGPSE